MKKRLQGFIAGTLSGIILASGIAIAANTTTLYDVMTDGIKIFVDGQKINPKDANGNRVEPFIYNGTTYLPVRAVADALGKAVYWDGPNYTVYLGKAPTTLDYPTLELQNATNIGDDAFETARILTDNYGNTYSRAIKCKYIFDREIHTLLNMKYSRFKCTIYVPEGCSYSHTPATIKIIADGKTIYSSPEITKTSAPIPVDIDIRGCNDFKIQFSYAEDLGYIADAGFYQ